jgi:glutathione S-transferase
MITIYHLDTSRSERIVWLMEELGLPYDLQTIPRTPNEVAPDAFQQIHPLGRAPVIRNGDVLLAESGAIVEYIVARHGGGRLSAAPSEPRFARYLYWLHYAEGSLMLQLLRERSLDRMLTDPGAAPEMARVRATTRRHLDFVEDALTEFPYFGGETFTAADIMMAFPFTTLRLFLPLDLAPFPALRAYLTRIETRAAYRKAMDVAGPGIGAGPRAP